ncbi:MAG: RNA-binding S4 domain-containing protein [Azonexus sp.]
MRLDKWLWAARFFKTRSLASDAVDGGKVKLNGAATKPAKDVKLGDRLQIRAGEQDWEIVVQGLNEQRQPASEAQLLYQETHDCVEKLPDVKYAYRIFSRGHQDDGEATERTGSSVLRLQP